MLYFPLSARGLERQQPQQACVLHVQMRRQAVEPVAQPENELGLF
jgi:hypothetical protein